MENHVVIVGSGIAGLASALALSRIGYRVTVLEKHSARREGGHFIRWLGAGTHALRRFNIPDIPSRANEKVKHVEISRAERRSFGVGLHEMPGNPGMILRGDIEDALHNAVSNAVDIRYGTTVQSAEQDGNKVRITTNFGDTLEADLLIGADGVRSQTRRRHFGADEEFMAPTGHTIGTWFAKEPFRTFPATEAPVFIEPGRSIWLFRYDNHDPCVLVSYRSQNTEQDREDGPKTAFARAFSDALPGGMVNELLHSATLSDNVVFDSAIHVDVPSYVNNRVMLIGDAAWSLTIFSGMGASLAVAAGEYLGAALLATNGDIPAGLALWQRNVRPFVDFHRAVSWNYLDFFTPDSLPVMRARKRMMLYNTHPLIAPWYRKLKAPQSRLFHGSMP